MSRPLNMSEVDWLLSEVKRLKEQVAAVDGSRDQQRLFHYENQFQKMNEEIQRLKKENTELREQLSRGEYRGLSSEPREEQ